MKNSIHGIALYTATILISALPFTMDVADASDKSKKQRVAVANNVAADTLEQLKKSGHKNQFLT
jgi:hypothetical protein